MIKYVALFVPLIFFYDSMVIFCICIFIFAMYFCMLCEHEMDRGRNAASQKGPGQNVNPK